MKTIAAAFACGTLFGIGLAMAEMTDPARVIGFLDIAGDWDPTLVLVMGAGLAVSLPLFPLVLKRQHPLFSENFSLPTKKDIDGPLLVGAALFGIGWGLAGLCPGPAIAALTTGSPGVLTFVAAMIAGQWLAARLAVKS